MTYYLEPQQKAGGYKMYKDYFNYIIRKGFNYKYSLFSLFLARGFLLDYIDENIYISDNSFDSSLSKKNNKISCTSVSDKDDLVKILEKLSLGYIIGNELIIIKEVDLDNVYRYLFEDSSKISISVERNKDRNGHSWSFDFTRIEPPKYPTMDLEAFIARYVKAISAAGVWTTFSCHGHVEKNTPMYISFYGRYNGLWHKIIVDEFLNEKNINLSWNHSKDYTYIESTDELNDDLYILILKAANCIYDNRKILRSIKQELVNSLKYKQKECLSDQDMYSLMSESFKNKYS